MKVRCLAAVIAACLLSAPAARTQDSEQRLADAQQASFAADKMFDTPRLSDEDAAARRAWVSRSFPGAGAIAEMEAEGPKGLLAAKKPREAVAAARAFLERYPEYGGLHAGVLGVMGNVSLDKNAPDEVRREAFDVVIAHCEHAGYALSRAQGYLQGAKLTPEERYAIAKRGEERAGPDAYARSFLCPYLEAYAAAAPAAVALAECDRFLKRYGDDSPESLRVRLAMLDVKAAGGDAAARTERSALIARQRGELSEFVALRKRLTAALDAGQLEEVERLAAEMAKRPAYAQEPSWNLQLMRACLTCPDAFRLRLFRTLLQSVRPSWDAEELLLLLSSYEVSGSPEAADLAIERWPRLIQNRGRDFRDALLRMKAVTASTDRQARACRAALSICDRLDMADARADVLRRLGLCLWDTDQPAAVEALRQAAGTCPRSQDSAEAAWFGDFLAGRNAVSQGALPREPSLLGKDGTAVAVPLPPVPPAAADVAVNNGQFALRALNVRESLLAKCAATVSGGPESGALLTDGRPDTVWTAGAGPCAFIVPLKQVSSVARLVLKMRDPAHAVVTLLDVAGKPLAKYERDGRLWEQFWSPAQWPPADVTLNLVPVPGVAFVRVDLADPLGAACAVREIEAYPPAYPALAQHLLRPTPLPGGAAALAVSWKAEEPVKEVTYLPSTESVRPWPAMRWSLPWRRPATAVGIGHQGRLLSVEFFGADATLSLKEAGGAHWDIDGVRHGDIVHPDKDAVDLLLAADLPEGRHLLTLENRPIPPQRDQWGPDGLMFAGLRVKGLSRVRVALRFATAKGEWTDWQPVAKAGAAVAVPRDAAGRAYTQYQVGLQFDSRAVLGTATASVQDIAVSPASTAVTVAAPTGAPPQVFPEELAEVARLVSARKVVVAYPKVGTVREYEAARRIADAARVYLVSDDIGLNLFDGLVLSVGRPASHRYCRQLLGMKMLWNDPAFLSNPDGVVGMQRDSAGQPAYLFATGESTEAAEKAAARLLQALRPAAASPELFRCFSADVLDSIHPWQIHAGVAAPGQLNLRLGRNDRRSVQFGVSADRKLDAIEVTCAALAAPGGAQLPPVIVRPVAFYEWVPFFGDLRLPNLLMNRPVFSLPANCATGVWLTVTTPKDAPPGTYSGTVTVSAGGQRVQLPLLVTVEPVTLPDAMRVETMSFASVPYWFHEGTPAGERALRELARDEAVHGVSVVHVRMASDIRWSESDVPRAQSPPGPSAKPSAQPYTPQPKSIAPGQQLRVEFSRPICPSQFYVTCSAASESSLSLDAQPAPGKQESFGKVKVPAGPEARALRFAGRGAQSAVWTLTNDGAVPVSVGVVRAFLNPAEKWPFIVDFTAMDREMEVIESVYRACGRPLPAFYGYLAVRPGPVLQEGGLFPPAVYRAFSEQLAEHLKQTGRLNRFYAKVSDEPADIAVWTSWARPVHESGLVTWTAHSGNYPNIDVAVGTMSFWCPNYAHDLKRPFWRERQKAGEKVWWYECGTPTTRLTGQLCDNLPFYWLTGKWRLDGAANYATMGANPTSAPVPFRYDHGMDHQIVFLADGTVLDTLRREVASEGIRDCSLILMVRDKADALRRRGDAAGADKLEQALADVLESVVPYKYGYATNPESWNKARNALYDLAR